MYHVMEIKISFTMSPRKLRNPDCRIKRRRLKKSWSDLRKGNVTNDNLSASGVKRECTERMKSVLWQQFGGNRDAPFRHRSPITSRDTQSCQMWNVFKQLFAAVSSYIHFSLGYKIPSIFLRPDKKVKEVAKQNGMARLNEKAIEIHLRRCNARNSPNFDFSTKKKDSQKVKWRCALTMSWQKRARAQLKRFVNQSLNCEGGILLGCIFYSFVHDFDSGFEFNQFYWWEVGTGVGW